MSKWVATAIPLFSIVGRVGFGWVGDKVDMKWVWVGAIAMISVGLFFFEYAAMLGTWLLVPFLFLFGIGFGSINPVRALLIRKYFGRSSFGTILGVMTGLLAFGTIGGPPLAGWVFDTWNSYQNIWLVFAGLNIIAIIAVVTMPRTSTTPQTG